ncbi:stage II sporulation protein M [Bacillus cereus group sp. N6]|uniref:stage II sporulation protein M n=1 Tax=Bacillus cereus group sp. N6 TaxID=2794583 RepID=UPI0018F63E88|nr:stage II sporulation protein M [Bacillus cereus group sp. N6]MBJ8111714.1 stage II sporulation protein M [Bacillus cereus group sp. N6]
MKFKKVMTCISIIAVMFYCLGLFFSLNVEKEVTDGNFGFTELLIHNLTSEMFSILLGIITLGVYSMMYLFLNFFSMGSITSSLMTEKSIVDVLSLFIVHGIFEIPAMILTVALGSYLPWRIISMFKKKEGFILILKQMFKILILILVLTIAAAITEAFVTPKLI